MTTVTYADADELRAKARAVFPIFDHYLKGVSEVGHLMMIAAIKGEVNHFLAEGLPGLAKTRSVEVFGRLINGRVWIIQGNPDTMPKDISGSEFFDKEKGIWRIRWTPLPSSNLIVVNEGNRMDTRTQGALFEPMSEGRVTVIASNLSEEDATRPMQEVNVVMFTQNPLDQLGTNPIPEAQKDRFLFWAVYDYPKRADELELMVDPRVASRAILNEIKPQISIDEILAARAWVQQFMRVSDTFRQYLLTVVRATRPGSEEFNDLWQKFPDIRPILDAIECGISPRANIALLEACRVRAFLFGTGEDGQSPRHFVMPEDLKALAKPVLRHRIVMKQEAAFRRVSGDAKGAQSVRAVQRGGTVTRRELYDRIKRPGPNPITSDDVVDALLTHIDFSNDWKLYDER